jgi:hypothetical protein
MRTSPIRFRIAAVGATAVLAAGAALTAAAPAGAATGASPLAVTGAASVSAPQARAAVEPKGKVVSRLPLSIREKPTTGSGYLGAFPSGAVIPLHCKVHGQNVDGNDLWYLLGGSKPGWVAARYVKNLSPVSYCK